MASAAGRLRLRLRRRQQVSPEGLHVASHELFSADKARIGRKYFRIGYGMEHVRLETFGIGLLIPMLHIGRFTRTGDASCGNGKVV
jgi:hypothetical protein